MFTARRLALLTLIASLLVPGIKTAFSKEIWLKALSDGATTYLSAGKITVHAQVSIQTGNDDLGAPSALTRGALVTTFTGSQSGFINSLWWGTGPFESDLTGGPILVSGTFAIGQTDIWAYTFTFYNPKDQYVTANTWGGWAYSAGEQENHIFSPHGNFEFTFKIASGSSTITGGDAPGGPAPPPGAPGSGPPASTNIHAVIISGRSDPAKIVTSQNVTLTGGIVALGKDSTPPAAPTTPWTTGLRIVPDPALLTGTKIPPLTPNIIDVRIVKHEVVRDLVAPSASPSP